ncbi:unnamed protein product [Phytophthora fragariaefolia]|uniref:Unnamed protein product n=1 Tax=Phytophthora fragariaefolia TaxID=1490495 RepID=A0A9W6U4N8_9STRA|nr:unnamed protein product [Phytophthora fragariaefolia]
MTDDPAKKHVRAGAAAALACTVIGRNESGAGKGTKLAQAALKVLSTYRYLSSTRSFAAAGCMRQQCLREGKFRACLGEYTVPAASALPSEPQEECTYRYVPSTALTGRMMRGLHGEEGPDPSQDYQVKT